MADYMIENIDNKNKYQYFADTTYYVTPTKSKCYEIFTILGFDLKEERTKLCLMSLIKNYKFKTKFITIDFNKACFKAIMKCFHGVNIIPCYFHLMKNSYKKLPEIKSKNNNLKKSIEFSSKYKNFMFY